MRAIDRLEATWELVGPFGPLQGAVARLFRARDDLVPPGVGR